jgi:predicted esterase
LSLRTYAFSRRPNAILCALATIAACPKRPTGSDSPDILAPTPLSSSSTEALLAPPLDPPKRVRRDSARVALATGNPRERSWQMHEAAPLIVPDTEPRPVTFLLHGMCADSSWTCDWLQYFEMAPQWQICPRAPHRCTTEEGYSWTDAAETRRLVGLSLATLKERHDGLVRDDATVFAGFSLGAYAVASLVHELAGRPSSSLHVRGVLAQGARVHFSASDLRALGARVALAAGDLDAAAPAMRAEAEKLHREGIDVRYVSLGMNESHFTSVSTGKIVAQLIDWCRGE